MAETFPRVSPTDWKLTRRDMADKRCEAIKKFYMEDLDHGDSPPKSINKLYDSALDHVCKTLYHAKQPPNLNEDFLFQEVDIVVWTYITTNCEKQPMPHEDTRDWSEKEKNAKPWSVAYGSYFHNTAFLDGDASAAIRSIDGTLTREKFSFRDDFIITSVQGRVDLEKLTADAVQAALKDAQEKYDALSKNLKKDFERERSSLTFSRDQLTEDIAELEQKLKSQAGKQVTKHSTAHTDARIMQMQAKVTSREKELEDLKLELSTVKDRIFVYKQQIQTITKNLEEANVKLAAPQRQEDAMYERERLVNDREMECDRREHTLNENEGDQSERLYDQKQELEDQTEELANVKTELNTVNDKLNAAKAKLEAVKAESKTAKGKKAKKPAEVDPVTCSSDDQQRELKDRKEALDKQQADIDNERAQTNHREDAIKDREDEVSKREIELKDQQAALAKAMADLQNAKEKVEAEPAQPSSKETSCAHDSELIIQCKTKEELEYLEDKLAAKPQEDLRLAQEAETELAKAKTKEVLTHFKKQTAGRDHNLVAKFRDAGLGDYSEADKELKWYPAFPTHLKAVVDKMQLDKLWSDPLSMDGRQILPGSRPFEVRVPCDMIRFANLTLFRQSAAYLTDVVPSGVLILQIGNEPRILVTLSGPTRGRTIDIQNMARIFMIVELWATRVSDRSFNMKLGDFIYGNMVDTTHTLRKLCADKYNTKEHQLVQHSLLPKVAQLKQNLRLQLGQKAAEYRKQGRNLKDMLDSLAAFAKFKVIDMGLPDTEDAVNATVKEIVESGLDNKSRSDFQKNVWAPFAKKAAEAQISSDA